MLGLVMKRFRRPLTCPSSLALPGNSWASSIERMNAKRPFLGLDGTVLVMDEPPAVSRELQSMLLDECAGGSTSQRCPVDDTKIAT